MSFSIKKTDSKTYEILYNQEQIGTISTYQNEFHNTCVYLKIKLISYPDFSPFEKIKEIEGKPLQVMIESSETELIKYLTSNGFECKRHCFCPEFTKTDLKDKLQSDHPIHYFSSEDSIYQKCCQLLYQHYIEISRPVSPYTADYETFLENVPTDSGFYSLDINDRVDNVIFTEKNEIAYVASSDRETCSVFYQSVLKRIFSKYDQTFFEADEETDWCAMTLLHLFNYDYQKSFNTYIYK